MFLCTADVKSKVIGVMDLLGAWYSSDTHPSLSHTLRSYYIWATSVDFPRRFGARSDPGNLYLWTEAVESKAIGERDWLG